MLQLLKNLFTKKGPSQEPKERKKTRNCTQIMWTNNLL